jgi:integrase/recombinase XerD
MSTDTQSSDLSQSAEALFQDWKQDAALQNFAEDTMASYVSCLRYFLRFLDDDPRAVDRDHLKAFLDHCLTEREARDGSTGLKPNSIKSYFTAIASFYKYLHYEGEIQDNPVPAFRDRYVDFDTNRGTSNRQLISVEEMATLVHATLNVRDRAVILLLAKTGIRRKELIPINLGHIDWERQSIRLQPTRKRTNLTVFFDGECARALERWLESRERQDPQTDALFISQRGTRLKKQSIYRLVTTHAEDVGLHDPDSTDPQERFTPHCCRHWFTTHLRRSGMQREFIQELRGDSRRDAIDIYDHIDPEELREAYLAHIPTLGL